MQCPKQKGTNGQTLLYKTLHRQVNNEQPKPH